MRKSLSHLALLLAIVLALVPVAARAAAIELEDGTYLVGVTLEGGSGRASVTSPARVEVSDGAVYATIAWSSPHYDYMVVDGERYLPTNEGGNSTFAIPIAGFDEPISVIADTTAMSQPHEIAYTLTFDGSSAVAEQPDSGNAGPWIAIGAACVAAVVCALSSLARKKIAHT